MDKHTGSCHCGAVRYEVDIEGARMSRCNCTICTKTAITGGIVKPSAFTLLRGEGDLGTYEWGMKVAKRHFCKHCGIHLFGRGHLEVLGGDFVSVNVNTLDDLDPWKVDVVFWDGRHDNWQAGPRKEPWPIG
ncbi:MAG TPA: GFA family protein [Labilithrix sp.]|jgi:hypothetical protein